MSLIKRVSTLAALAVLAGALSPAYSQVLYLRTGGPQSRIDIINATNGDPIVITTRTAHGLAAGDIVAIQFVRGNNSANGIRKVKTCTATTCELTDAQSGTNISGNGQYVANSGYVGKVQPTSLRGFPRVFLDGPTGTITTAVEDPDGVGPAVAPKADPSWVAYAALRSQVDRYAVGAPEQHYTAGALRGGWSLPQLGLVWYMDNSKTSHLAAAKHYMLNLDRFLGSGYDGNFSGCVIERQDCGTSTGSNMDWAAYISTNVGVGYGILRNEFTPAERKSIADRMLNGLFNEGCENTLTEQSGTVAHSAGSKTVTGTGTSFDSSWIGKRIYVGPNTWRGVTAVNSASELTVDTAFTETGTAAEIRLLKDWTPSSCGYMWFLAHHQYQPYPLGPGTRMNTVGAIDANTTTVVVTRAQEILDIPGYINIGSEWMRVTERVGSRLTVIRGQLATAAASHNHNSIVEWLRYPAGGKSGSNAQATPLLAGTNILYYESPNHNLVFAKLMTMLTVGAAFASDDPRAARLLEEGWNYFYDSTYYNAKVNWTGLTQGGAAYGLDRWLDWMTQTAVLAKHTFSPAIDIADGQWLTSALRYPVYRHFPEKPSHIAPVWDSGVESVVLARKWKYLMTLNAVSPGHPDLAYSNYYQRTATDNYAIANLDNNEIPHIAVLFTSPTDPQSDWRALPRYHFFTKRDYRRPQAPNLGYYNFTSRTSWTDPHATLLWGYVFTQPNDHISSYPVPGAIQIIRGDTYLLGANTVNFVGFNDPAAQSGVQIGGTNTLPTGTMLTAAGVYGQYGHPDRTKGTSEYVYWRVNNASAYRTTAKVSQHFRHVLHLLDGAQDYIVTYDEVTTTQPSPKALVEHYPVTKQTGSTTATFSLNGNQVEFSRAGKHKINSAVLLPQESSKIVAESSAGARTARVNDGLTTKSEFLVVHRAAAISAGAMPPVAMIATISPTWRGVQIADPERTRVVLVPKDGSQSNTEVQVTPDPYSGTASVTVAGLSSGTYNITIGGVVVLKNRPVTVDGTLRFTSVHGTFGIKQGGPAPIVGNSVAAAGISGTQSAIVAPKQGLGPVGQAGAPKFREFAPYYGSGQRATFTVTYNHSPSEKLSSIDVMFRQEVGPGRACYIQVRPGQHSLALLNDAGTAWVGSVTTGMHDELKNTRCTVDATGSSIERSKDGTTARLALSFSDEVHGKMNIFTRAENDSRASEWLAVGSWWRDAEEGTAEVRCLEDSKQHVKCTSHHDEYSALSRRGFAKGRGVFRMFSTPALSGSPARLPVYRLDEVLGNNQIWTTDRSEYLRLASLPEEYVGMGIQVFAADAPSGESLRLESVLPHSSDGLLHGYATSELGLRTPEQPVVEPTIAAVTLAGADVRSGIAPNQVVSVYGFNLVREHSTPPVVLVDGVRASVYRSAHNELTVAAPPSMHHETARVQVIVGELQSNVIEVPVVRDNPLVFTKGDLGRGEIIVGQESGGTVLDRVAEGDRIMVFVSGVDTTDPLQLDITAWIGGRAATVSDVVAVPEVPGTVALAINVPTLEGSVASLAIRVGYAFTQSGAILRSAVAVNR